LAITEWALVGSRVANWTPQSVDTPSPPLSSAVKETMQG